VRVPSVFSPSLFAIASNRGEKSQGAGTGPHLSYSLTLNEITVPKGFVKFIVRPVTPKGHHFPTENGGFRS